MLGLTLSILAIAIYAAQFYFAIFKTPWYMPILGTLGVLFFVIGCRQQRTVGRLIGLVFWALLATGEWFFLLSMTRVPAYTGPLAAGKSLPAFSASFADDKPFTRDDLEHGEKTVLLFFRGRW
jgi:hypothetical protein